MSFSLEAAPNTDIWRKPPGTNVWIAPVSRTESGPLSKFRSARTTFWADWTEQYDQAGLLLVPRRRSSVTTPAQHWIKTGLEFYMGAPQLSTVNTERFADWSIGPITTPIDPAQGITIEIVREGDDSRGKSAWIYQLVVDPNGSGDVKQRIPLREICWIFADEHEGGGDEWVIDVSPLVARPEKSATGPLRVNFSEFRVEWLH